MSIAPPEPVHRTPGGPVRAPETRAAEAPAPSVRVELVTESGEVLVLAEHGEDSVTLQLWAGEPLQVVDRARWPEDRSTVLLEFPEGVTEGWVALDRERTEGWCADPSQSGANWDVLPGDCALPARAGRAIEIVVGRMGRVRGRVLQPDKDFEAWVRSVRVTAMGDPPDRSRPALQRHDVFYKPFVIEDVPAGFVRLEFLVEHPGGRRPRVCVAVVEDVFVPLGGETEDARIDPIDLRSSAERTAIAVVNDEGARLPRARVTLLGLGRSSEFRRPNRDGEIEVLLPNSASSPAARPEVWAHASGYVPQRVDPPFENAVAVLDRSLEIVVELEGVGSTGRGEEDLRFRLRKVDYATGELLPEFWTSHPRSDWRRRVGTRTRVPGPGTYEVEVGREPPRVLVTHATGSDRYRWSRTQERIEIRGAGRYRVKARR